MAVTVRVAVRAVTGTVSPSAPYSVTIADPTSRHTSLASRAAFVTFDFPNSTLPVSAITVRRGTVAPVLLTCTYGSQTSPSPLLPGVASVTAFLYP